MKNTVSEMKDTLEGINIRLDGAEEQISREHPIGTALKENLKLAVTK